MNPPTHDKTRNKSGMDCLLVLAWKKPRPVAYVKQKPRYVKTTRTVSEACSISPWLSIDGQVIGV